MGDVITGYLGYMIPARTVVIPAGEQESDPINVGGMALVGIIFPSLLTGTALSFMVGDSEVGYQATGQAVFSGHCTNNDTLEINGVVITFKDVVDDPDTQVLIGADAAGTVANLQAVLDATEDADLLACTYESSGTLLVVTAVAHGTAPNAFTFAKSSTNITLTPSGGTLTGGGFRPLYNASNALVSMTVAAGRAYAVDPANFQGVSYLKLKSGSSELQARNIICSLKGF